MPRDFEDAKLIQIKMAYNISFSCVTANWSIFPLWALNFADLKLKMRLFNPHRVC